jgi:hypothetical protein
LHLLPFKTRECFIEHLVT